MEVDFKAWWRSLKGKTAPPRKAGAHRLLKHRSFLGLTWSTAKMDPRCEPFLRGQVLAPGYDELRSGSRVLSREGRLRLKSCLQLENTHSRAA